MRSRRCIVKFFSFNDACNDWNTEIDPEGLKFQQNLWGGLRSCFMDVFSDSLSNSNINEDPSKKVHSNAKF